MSDSSAFQYQIVSDGENTGKLSLKYLERDVGYLISEYSEIKASGWWGKVDIDSHVFEQYDSAGNLLEADSKVVDGGTAYWNRLERRGLDVWGVSTEVDRISRQEEKQLTELAIAVSSAVVPAVSEVLAISNALFSERKQPKEAVRFSEDLFDSTFHSFPLWLKNFEGKSLPSFVNLLDTESLSISKWAIKDRGVATVTVGANHLKTRHFELSFEGQKPTEIWIREIPEGLPHIVKFTGEDEDGQFMYVLKPPRTRL